MNQSHRLPEGPGQREPKRPTAVNPWLPIMAILAAVILWGGSFAGMRVALKELSTWMVMWLRMMCALLILLPFIVKLKNVPYRPGDWKRLLPLVLLQPCFYFLLESNALCYTTASQAGVISASVPLMVALGAAVFLSERLTRRVVAGLSLSIVGVAGLTFLGTPDGTAQNALLGNAMELGAMACAAGNMLLVKKLSRRYNPWMLTAFQVMAGALFFSPGVSSLQMPTEVWSVELVLVLVYLGGFVTLGAFGLYNWGMSRITATRASAFIKLVPVTAVFFGWVLLGERLNLPQGLSALCIMGGVWLSQKAPAAVTKGRPLIIRKAGIHC